MTTSHEIPDAAPAPSAPAHIAVAILIPAYKPPPALVETVRELARLEFEAVVVVDDGSGPTFLHIFEEIQSFRGVRVIRHAVNLGKGAALKTGINFCLVEFPRLRAVVTADADGQHDSRDVQSVAARFAQRPGALILGARAFSGGVPLRSRLGNSITRAVMRIVAGQRLADTQTGLRAIPRDLMERMLSVPASGYEFELEMLIAAKHLGVEVVEQPVRTIYEPGNISSHFQPLRDSMRIYFVLLRFGFISLTTAVLDNLAFYLFFRMSGVVAVSLAGARLMALAFNYAAVRKAVFLSSAQHRNVLPRYLLLAAVNVCVSYALISFLTRVVSFGVMPAKICGETVLFIANFAVQRDFVFRRRVSAEPAR